MSKRWYMLRNQVESEATSKKKPTKKVGPKKIIDTPYSDLYSALYPIYHISKFFGTLPVAFKRLDYKYRGTTEIWSSIYGVFLVVSFASLQVWGLWRDLNRGWQNSTRLNSETAITATCLDVFAVFMLISSIIFGAPFRWKFIQGAMDKMVEVDRSLGEFKRRRLHITTFLIASLTFMFVITLSSLDYACWKFAFKVKKPAEPADKGPINYVPIYGMYMILTMFEIQYCVLVYNVSIRFQRINETIDKQSKGRQIVNYFIKDLALDDPVNRNEKIVAFLESDLAYFKGKKPDHLWPIIENNDIQRKIAMSISKLIILYGHMCDAVILLNNSYGITLIIATLSCLIHLIITPYFLYMEINAEIFIWQTIVMQVFWCIFHIMRLLLLVQPCNRTMAEGRKTGILISKLLSSDWGPEVRKQLEIFSLQLLLRPVYFTAYGLFTLDRSLLASVTGVVTTYLVIMIQFQTTDDEQGTKFMLKNATQLLTSVKNNVTLIRSASALSS